MERSGSGIIDWEARVVGDQVQYRLLRVDPSLTEYRSEDGFFTLHLCGGYSQGTFGYGELTVWAGDDELTLLTPHYEHEQDLLDIMERVTKAMEGVNGNAVR